jgi:hypothetical protein
LGNDGGLEAVFAGADEAVFEVGLDLANLVGREIPVDVVVEPLEDLLAAQTAVIMHQPARQVAAAARRGVGIRAAFQTTRILRRENATCPEMVP